MPGSVASGTLCIGTVETLRKFLMRIWQIVLDDKITQMIKYKKRGEQATEKKLGQTPL